MCILRLLRSFVVVYWSNNKNKKRQVHERKTVIWNNNFVVVFKYKIRTYQTKNQVRSVGLCVIISFPAPSVRPPARWPARKSTSVVCNGITREKEIKEGTNRVSLYCSWDGEGLSLQYSATYLQTFLHESLVLAELETRNLLLSATITTFPLPALFFSTQKNWFNVMDTTTTTTKTLLLQMLLLCPYLCEMNVWFVCSQ